jgi:hypothetical protein
MTGTIAPRAVTQSAVDWFKNRYPDGAERIRRWAAAGEIEIVDQKVTNHETNSAKSN